MLQEEVCWFAQRGSQPLEIPLDVTGEVPDSTAPGILRARIEVVDPGPRLQGGRGEAVPIRIRVTNAGNTCWRHTSTQGRGHVALGGRLVADAAPPKDHFRARLPRDVDPGDTVEVMAEVPLPERAGRYRLMLDMVDEGIAWFAWEHSPGPTLEVVVL
jgi:hypothetical protein